MKMTTMSTVAKEISEGIDMAVQHLGSEMLIYRTTASK